MRPTPTTVWNRITAHLKNGVSLRSLGDAIQIGAAELILRTTVPRQFTDGQHPFDYCNAANYWMRTSDNPYQPRVLYLMAHFVNDVGALEQAAHAGDRAECAGFDASGRTPAALLQELDEAILAFDVPRTTAVADAYLRSGADRRAFQSAVALTACKFQDDPHNQKITHSPSRSTADNSTHLRDRLLLAGGSTAGGLAEDAGRARLLRPLHAGVDQRLAGLPRERQALVRPRGGRGAAQRTSRGPVSVAA